MNTMLITTALCAILGIGLAVLTWKGKDSYGDWPILTGLVAGCLLLAAILIPSLTYGSRAYGRVECRNWSHQTGRPTKFVIYTSWSGGDCLTRSANGKWISKDMLREFGSQP